MRRALLIGALAVVLPAAASAQAVDTSTAPAVDRRLRAEIAILSRLLGSIHVPAADSFRIGNREVTAGSSQRGTVAVARGNLAVRGRIEGDALVLHGDVLVYPGGVITGQAVAVDGRVHPAGGVIEGDVRSVRGIAGGILAHAARTAEAESLTPWAAMKIVLGWFAVLCAIGIGVLLFAEKNLDGVVLALEQEFSRSFWTGVLAQLGAIPALLLLLVGLAITILGILLVPFAVVAYVIALAGVLTLGFLATARLTGRAFFRGQQAGRTVHLRALVVGLVIYLGLWFLAAALTANPVASSVMRAIALAGTWVAATLGLGATIISKAGTRRDGKPDRVKSAPSDLSWQTPTPVSGVVAARRPVATVKDAR